jgi:CheY-like chemotaxis protein
VDSVTSGAEAINAVKQKCYNLIFMDYLMPVMNGAEAARQIRALSHAATDCENVPVIALTANTEASSQKIFADSGANDFLPKPLDAVRLHGILEKWLPAKMRTEDTTEDAPAYSLPPDFHIPGIDLAKGIAKTGGSPEIYLRVLNHYCESGRKRIREMRTSAENGDMVTYHFHAHALASISESIGANDVALGMRELEQASAQGDAKLVLARTPAFLAQFETLLNDIAAAETKKKILFIDDTSTYLLILNEIFGGDYETYSAVDAEDGIETAKAVMPDLIMLDFIMPGMSGYDAIKILKSDDALKNIPIVLMSGKEAAKNEEEGRALGAVGYIKKPFDTADVKEKINLILGGSLKC